MTLFDTLLINLHRGFEKLSQGAAFFSDRIKLELAVVRARIKAQNMRDRIGELQALIGRRAAELRESDAPPKTFSAFLKDEEVAAAVEEIEKLDQEIDELMADVARGEADVAAAMKEAAGEEK